MEDVSVVPGLDMQLANEQAFWVARCRRGDESAMATLVAKHRKRLLRVATNVLRDSYEAEDVVQEAFVKAFREVNRLRDDRAFSSYIYRICVRLCMDRMRAKKADTGIVEVAKKSEGSSVETRVVVEKLLAMLTPEFRMTLILREMEQLSYEEVAEVMRVPVGTVRSRLHAAREKFRAIWREEMKEDS